MRDVVIPASEPTPHPFATDGPQSGALAPGSSPVSKAVALSGQGTLHAGRWSIAHLRRLVLLVVGSVAGTAILAVQTYILHQQTLLLAKQTEALLLDQTVHIRERVAAASGVEDSVRRLFSALDLEANRDIGAPAQLGGVLKIHDFFVNACLAPDCSHALMDDTLRAITTDNGVVKPEVALGLLRLAAFLQHIDEAVRPVFNAPTELDMNKRPDKLGPLKALVTSGVTQCFFDPTKGRELSENMARLRLVSSNATFVSAPLANAKQFRQLSAKFPQVSANTTTGMIELSGAVDEIMNSVRKNARTATFDEFLVELSHAYHASLDDLRDLERQCSATIESDVRALKSMSVSRAR